MLKHTKEKPEHKSKVKRFNAMVWWRELFKAFPPLDPASEFYDEPVDGAEVIQWISEHAKDIRSTIG